MNIRVVTEPIVILEVEELAKETYETMIKGVVDVERRIVALGGEYHIDANNRLIDEGSKQPHIWGFNIHFDRSGDEWIEFRSLINIRPAAGNRDILLKDPGLQEQVRKIVERLILRA